MDLRCASTRRLKDFITTEFRAMGLESLSPVGLCFLGRVMMGELETGWHMACLQGGVKAVGKQRQLVSTVLEGGWRDSLAQLLCGDSVLNSLFTSLLNGKIHHCRGGEASLVERGCSGLSNCLSNLK